MIANVSHELRTPLAGVRARLENMVDGVEPVDEQRLATMLASVERLGRLVEQLLDLSRLEAGAALDREPFLARDVVDAVVEEVGLTAPDRAVRVAADRNDRTVDGDAERVHQVLANLVHNALRHSPAETTVDIAIAGDAASTSIAITDRGLGIPPELHDRVFDRYFRVDGPSSGGARPQPDADRPIDGSGLGLSIARWIVELHGGSIEVDAVAPTGCRMVVTLPAARQEGS